MKGFFRPSTVPARTRVLHFVYALALAYGAICLLAYFGQRSIIYPAPSGAVPPGGAQGALLEIEAPSIGTVFATWRPPRESEGPVLVYFHGNAELLHQQLTLVVAMAQEGVGVLAVEYPGYGLARDRTPAVGPSEDALYRAAEAALAHLRDRLGVPPARTTLVGRSLGSGVATEMARRGHGARLALMSPYTSIPAMGRTVLPFLPAAVLVRDRFDNEAKAPEIAMPTWIAHGERDEVIPFWMGEHLSKRFPAASFLRLADTGHNDIEIAPGTGLMRSLAAFARGPERDREGASGEEP